ncbi:MAG: hypothetical protein ABR567_09405 [Myxococcales bacterium]|nr:hypothetical protein [Myxococcales bacterium]
MKAVLAAALLLCACGGATSVSDNPSVQDLAPERDTAIVHVPLFIRDAAGQIPTDPAALVYEARLGNPVLARDGHQLTLAEFNAPRGRASVKCVERGTHAVLELTGLIPFGVYTVWNVVFRAPGFDPSFANLIALGAIGESDGSQNSFVADSTGAGSVSAITPGGPLSAFGSIAGCALAGEFEFHLVGAYHIDGRTHGETPGAAGTFVEQFGFMFKR